MKYKFKPQTAILVAGIMAAAYSEACVQQATQVLCVTSGTSLSTDVQWHNSDGSNGLTASPTARTDWYYAASDALQLNVATGYNSYTADYSSYPAYCYGPAQFTDAAGQLAYATWENYVGSTPWGASWGWDFGTVNTADTCQ